MLSKKTAILHQSSESRSDYVGNCRFFNNKSVNHQQISKPLIEQTAQAAAGKSVAIIQDTSEANYESHAGYLSMEDEELGPVGNNTDIGFFMHPSIVIDETSGLLLGASDVCIWNRSHNKGDKHGRQYNKLPIEEKESNRWIASAQRSKTALKDAGSILFIADREGDIYEGFAAIPDERCDVLIRSRTSRELHNSDTKLHEMIAEQPVEGNILLTIRDANKRTGREATLAIRYCKVRIARPRHLAKEGTPDYVEVYAVEAKETSTSIPSAEKPVRWILLTTRNVNNLKDALSVIKLYGQRWQIELVFATMKSKGLNMEESQLESGKALKSIAVMSLITAIKVNQLRMARDNNTLPATIIFTAQQIALMHLLLKKLEGKTDPQKNHHPPETIAWAAWIIARLGGWKGYTKNESPPGNKTMFWGWNKFETLYEGWQLLN